MANKPGGRQDETKFKSKRNGKPAPKRNAAQIEKDRRILAEAALAAAQKDIAHNLASAASTRLVGEAAVEHAVALSGRAHEDLAIASQKNLEAQRRLDRAAEMEAHTRAMLAQIAASNGTAPAEPPKTAEAKPAASTPTQKPIQVSGIFADEVVADSGNYFDTSADSAHTPAEYVRAWERKLAQDRAARSRHLAAPVPPQAPQAASPAPVLINLTTPNAAAQPQPASTATNAQQQHLQHYLAIIAHYKSLHRHPTTGDSLWHAHNPNDPHSGHSFYNMTPGADGKHVNGFDITPTSVTPHLSAQSSEAEKDKMLAAAILAAARLTHGDIHVQNASQLSADMMQRMQRITAQLAAAGAFTNIDGTPLRGKDGAPLSAIKFHGNDYALPTATTPAVGVGVVSQPTPGTAGAPKVTGMGTSAATPAKPVVVTGLTTRGAQRLPVSQP